MTEQIIGAELVNPAAANGRPGAATRGTNPARGLPPSTWLNRSSRIEYVDAHGSDEETSDVHLDHCLNGLVMNIEDAKTLVCWYRLSVVELAGA